MEHGPHAVESKDQKHECRANDGKDKQKNEKTVFGFVVLEARVKLIHWKESGKD